MLETLSVGGIDFRDTYPNSVPPGGSVKVTPIWTSEVATLLDGRQRTFRAPNRAGYTVSVTIPDGYGMPAGAAALLMAAAGSFGTVSVTENLSGQGMQTWTGFVEEVSLDEIAGTGRQAWRGSFRLRVEE